MEARIADISTRLTESRNGLGFSTLHTDAAGQPSFLHLLLFLTFLANGGFCRFKLRQGFVSLARVTILGFGFVMPHIICDTIRSFIQTFYDSRQRFIFSPYIPKGCILFCIFNRWHIPGQIQHDFANPTINLLQIACIFSRWVGGNWQKEGIEGMKTLNQFLQIQFYLRRGFLFQYGFVHYVGRD